jgi:hypothetical protein
MSKLRASELHPRGTDCSEDLEVGEAGVFGENTTGPGEGRRSGGHAALMAGELSFGILRELRQGEPASFADTPSPIR